VCTILAVLPAGFYTNQKSWLGLDGVECESEQLDAEKALAGSQKWLDSLGVGGVCQWKVDDWTAACECVKTEKAAVDAGGTVCQECTKTLYESTVSGTTGHCQRMGWCLVASWLQSKLPSGMCLNKNMLVPCTSAPNHIASLLPCRS